jgi:Fe2+ or Zn2+ uptake regulation protein
MNVFESAGLVFRVAIWKGHARYDPITEAHTHFLCETCGRIRNVKKGNLVALDQLAPHVAGKVRCVRVMIYGRNPTCAARLAKKNRGLKTSQGAPTKSQTGHRRKKRASKGEKSSSRA